MIDPDGYRPNVGIILMRDDGSVFWARRAYRDGWQFPQGGMRSDETPLEAMYRELHEETGLRPDMSRCSARRQAGCGIGCRNAIVRRITAALHRPEAGVVPAAVPRRRIHAARRTDKPEFDLWRWVDFWYPVTHVVTFKREVYAARCAISRRSPTAQRLLREIAEIRRPGLITCAVIQPTTAIAPARC